MFRHPVETDGGSSDFDETNFDVELVCLMNERVRYIFLLNMWNAFTHITGRFRVRVGDGRSSDGGGSGEMKGGRKSEKKDKGCRGRTEREIVLPEAHWWSSFHTCTSSLASLAGKRPNVPTRCSARGGAAWLVPSSRHRFFVLSILVSASLFSGNISLKTSSIPYGRIRHGDF